MQKADRFDMLKLVAELFLGDNPPTNTQAAATISRQLGRTVTVKNVSQMRNSLGLGWYPGSQPTKRQQEEARLVARWLA